jgi:hypothetical protein
MEDEIGRHVARIGLKMIKYRLFVWEVEGKIPAARQRRMCMDNIKIDLREIG